MLVPSLLLTGIALGLLYGLAAMAFNLIFTNTHIFDMSVGSTYVIAGYLYYALAVQAHVFLALAVAASLAAAGIWGLIVYRCVYVAIERRGSRLGRRARPNFFSYFVASLGILIIVQNAFAMVFGSANRSVGDTLLKHLDVFGASVPRGDYVAIGVVVVVWIALEMFLKRTPYGARFRALAENPELLNLIGQLRRSYFYLTFGIGSVLIAVCAILTMYLQGISPSDGLTVAVDAVAAMLVGGVGSYRGSLVGGLIFGVVENLSVWKLPGAWEQAIGFAVVLVVLFVRPTGVLGATAR